MHIILNGVSYEVTASTTIRHLLETLYYADKRVAVERNGQIVPKSQHAETFLQENDSLEIVVAVGGG